MQSNLRSPTYRYLHKGLRTHNRILGCAIDLAASIGLESLTFGRLAKEVSMSKSGVFSHFGSKEALQLEILDFVWGSFQNRFRAHRREEPHGLPLLLALVTTWSIYVSSRHTGAFLLAAFMEYDDRPGVIRDAVEGYGRMWTGILLREAEEAQRNGHLKDGTEPHVLVFQLEALVTKRMFDQGHGNLTFVQLNRAIRRACSEEGRRTLAEQRRLEREYWRSWSKRQL